MKKMFIVAVTALVIGLTGCTTPNADYSVNENEGIWTKVEGPGVITKKLDNGAVVLESWGEMFVVTPTFETQVGQKVDVFIHIQHGSDEWAIVNVVLAQ